MFFRVFDKYTGERVYKEKRRDEESTEACLVDEMRTSKLFYLVLACVSWGLVAALAVRDFTLGFFIRI
jgi:hypothetical protein